MGLAEDILVIIGVISLMGGLPFAMERLDQAMDQTSATSGRPHWWRHRP